MFSAKHGHLPTTHFVLLDGLRGIAAMAVVMMHIGDRFGLTHWADHGYLAVPFFFMLSGFVIAHAYEDGLMRRVAPATFMAVRIERLYPLLLAGLALATIVAEAQGGGGARSWPAMLAAGLMMVPLPGAATFPLLPPQWSLALELFGNMLHCGLRRFMRLRTIMLALPPLLIAMTTGAYAFCGLGSGWKLGNLAGGIATFLFCYTFGIVLYRLWRSAWLPRIALPAWAIVLLLLATFLLPQPLRTPANGVRDMICAVLIHPIVLIAATQVRLRDWHERLAETLGRLSYPLYITHYPVVVVACAFVGAMGLPRIAHYAVSPVMLLAAIGLAWGLLVTFDEPVRRRLKTIRAARAATQPSAGPA